MAAKHGLGRGLGGLLKDGMTVEPTPAATGGAPAGPQRIAVAQIRRSSVQPRHVFEEAPLTELTESIRALGVLQPLLVRVVPGGYELIAGERRLRAAMAAGLKDVPVNVLTASDTESLEMALVENLQRQNLNVLEEAQGYQALAEKFGMTQEQIAQRVGKARPTVANALRLLSLHAEIKGYLAQGQIEPGHAKALLGVQIENEQILLARRVVKENLSVRNLEKLIQRLAAVPRKPRVSSQDIPPAHLRVLCDKLHQHFGTAVRVTPTRTFANGKKAKGWIEIDFHSNDEFTRVLEILGIPIE